MQRTFTVGGTNVSDKKFIALKRLLKERGVDAGLVDSCCGVQALRLIGIKQGVLRADEEVRDDGEQAQSAPPTSLPAAELPAQAPGMDAEAEAEADARDAAMMETQMQEILGEDADCFMLNCNKVLDNLYVGGESAAEDAAVLASHGITHIFVPAFTGHPHTPPPLHEGRFHYKIWPVMDVPGWPVIQVFPAFVAAIEAALLDPAAKVLVHCASGVSRSAAVVAAYLMKAVGSGQIDPGLIRARRTDTPTQLCNTVYSYLKNVRSKISERKFKDQLILWGELGFCLPTKEDHSAAAMRLRKDYSRVGTKMRAVMNGEEQGDWPLY